MLGKKKKMNGDIGSVIFEDEGELLSPTPEEPLRRIPVKITLAGNFMRNILDSACLAEAEGKKDFIAHGSALGGIRLANRLCICKQCLDTSPVLVVATQEKRRKKPDSVFVFVSPLRALIPQDCPDQLRVFKDACTALTPGSCVILFPRNSAKEWMINLKTIGALEPAENASGQKVDIPPDAIRVARPLGDSMVEGVANTTVHLKHVTETGETVSSNLNDVLDIVANQALGEIPTMYNLCWSGRKRDVIVGLLMTRDLLH